MDGALTSFLSSFDPRRTMLVAIDQQMGFGANAMSAKLRGLRPSESDEASAVADLARYLYERGGWVVASVDWHERCGTQVEPGVVDTRCAEEEVKYGAHCNPGTSDVRLDEPFEDFFRWAESVGGPRTIIPVDKYDRTGQLGQRQLIELHKNTECITEIDLIGRPRERNQAWELVLLDAAAMGIDHLIFAGKLAEVCVPQCLFATQAEFPQFTYAVAPDGVASMPADIAKWLGLTPKEAFVAGLAAKNVATVTLADLQARAR